MMQPAMLVTCINGSDMVDINNDGWLDVFTTDMLPENDYRLKTTTKFDDYDVNNMQT